MSEQTNNLDISSVGLVKKQTFTFGKTGEALTLDSGRTLAPVSLAFETCGTLNEDKSNAILICHALTGDSHVAGSYQADDPKPGWWDIMIGPGKPIDTDKFFVICSNTIGGCMGSTGPLSRNPETDQPYGAQFPVVTIGDMVRCQRRLVDSLGIDKLLAVVGGSVGGMQVLEWSVRYPDRVCAALPLATTWCRRVFSITSSTGRPTAAPWRSPKKPSCTGAI